MGEVGSVFLMAEESLETRKQIDRGVRVEIQQLSEESHAVVVMECLGARDKTESEGDATMMNTDSGGDDHEH